MKKILLIIQVLIAIPSCSIEDYTPPQNTAVTIAVGNEFNPTTTGKNVQRGSIFAWISEMQIVATHENGYTSTTNFTLVPNGTAGAETQFTMDNVQIGNNVFTASSKTNEPERLETAQFPRPNGATSPTSPAIIDQFNKLKTRNPYAVYTSTNPVSTTITQGIAQEVNIPMKTDNSRIIAVFATDDINSNNSGNVVTITCYANGVSIGPPATCTNTMDATFYWSDRNAIANKSISFKIVNNDRGTIDTYNTAAIVMKASNTVKMLYTIKDKKIITTPM